MSTMASTMHIDYVTSVVTINGIPLPFHLAEEGPTVESSTTSPVLVVNLPVMVDGVVTIRTNGDLPTHGTTQIIDGRLGDVGEFGRRLAREGFLDAFPWLRLPPRVETGATA